MHYLHHPYSRPCVFPLVSVSRDAFRFHHLSTCNNLQRYEAIPFRLIQSEVCRLVPVRTPKLNGFHLLFQSRTQHNGKPLLQSYHFGVNYEPSRTSRLLSTNFLRIVSNCFTLNLKALKGSKSPQYAIFMQSFLSNLDKIGHQLYFLYRKSAQKCINISFLSSLA